MLGTEVILERRGGMRAGCAWFNQRLWVGACSPAGTLVLHAVNVRGRGEVEKQDSGLPFGAEQPPTGQETTALAVQGDRLWIAFGRLGGPWFLTSTTDEVAFDAPVKLPMDGGVLGASGLAAHPGGLALFWTEAIGSRARLTETADGQAFDEIVLPFRAQRHPALLYDPAHDEWVLAYAGNATRKLTTIYAAARAAPSVPLRALNISCAGQPGDMALCRSRYHFNDRLHLAVQLIGDGGGIDLVAHTLPTDLASASGAEPGGGGGQISVSLGWDGGVAWAVTGRRGAALAIEPYIQAFDLPPELAAQLEQPCEPGTCPEDPRLACLATDDFDPKPFWRPPHIANALKGDLILTAGDGRGTIGSMLEQLQPRQTFDHMGIMLADHDLVRHCTMAHERLKDRRSARFMTGTLAGEKVPSDGFRPEGLRHGWPGTLTQTIEDAFFEGRNSWNFAAGRPWNPQGDLVALRARAEGRVPAWAPPPPLNASNEANAAFAAQLAFADPDFPEDTFFIHNFPDKPAFRPDSGQLLDGLVVKPPPGRQAAMRPILGRIAEESARISGHYRFFAYTRADIAFDPAMSGPLGSWAAGTLPLVCSTFVWAAVERLRRQGVGIELEGRVAEAPEEKLPQPFRDGLYLYDETERRAAGRGLHDRMVQDIREQVLQALMEMDHNAGAATTIARIGIAGLTALLAGPAAAAGALLGLKDESLAELTLLLNDMPEQVATQMCNTFAYDDAEQTETPRWENPGEGVTVSPDDIAKFWDAPRGAARPELWEGLYGHTERLLLVPWQPERRRIHQLGRSRGPASAWGEVRYGGSPVEGALITLGCERTFTGMVDGRRPSWRLDLAAAGRQVLKASAYWPGTAEMLRGEMVVDLLAGDNPDLHITLEEPPEWRRRLRVSGTVDLVRKVLIGRDDTSLTPVVMQHDFHALPVEWGMPPDPKLLEWKPDPVRSGFAQRFCVVITLEADLDPRDHALALKVGSMLCENHFDGGLPPAEKVIIADHRRFRLAQGDTAELRFDHNSGNVPPDRAAVVLKLENLRVPS